MKPQVAVILPVCNSMPYLPVMLGELRKSTNFPFKLIIIESESDDGTAEYVDRLELDNLEVYHTKKKGLPAAINFGIQKAGDLDVYLTQDDVIHFKLYGRDWLMEMWEASKKKGVGVVTGLGGHGKSGPEYVTGMNWAGTWNTYIPRKAIEKVGSFDENMSPGDDIDFCYRLGKAGFRGTMCNFWVQHHRLTEHGDVDSQEKTKKMSQYFKKKWGLK